MESIGSAISIIGTIILILLKSWQDGKPQRTKEAADAEVNQGRLDVANGNAAAVGARIDSVPEAAAGDTAKLGSDEDTARRLAEITGS